jgi:hypothetical protein
VVQIGNAAGDPGSLGAFLGITSPAACGSAALNSPSGSSFWGAGPIAPGATATSLFNGFQAAGSAGTYTLWIAVNYMVGSLDACRRATNKRQCASSLPL